MAERGIDAFADGFLSPIEIINLFTASLFFLSWLLLKPDATLDALELDKLPTFDPHLYANRNDFYANAAQTRMHELNRHHMIRQVYILPFPYLCQIYHLLNLKHLEHVHSFSLNNLKVVQVSDFQATPSGGMLRFQTMLDSPMNALRIWRQPIVEVELILHSAYTVELSIPVYRGRRIIVMFNTLPLNSNEHQLTIDIYSNLGWFKPFLQLILHVASCLTMFEDLPYLRRLAERNVQGLVRLGRVSKHESMQLFKQFVHLYGSATDAVSTGRLKSAEVPSNFVES